MGSAPLQDQFRSIAAVRRPGQIRVMIIDDSITARSALARTIDGHTHMTVAATAGSAEVGLELLDARQVDVILLDLEMPGMGGLKALPSILAKSAGAKVLVVSSRTTAGAEPTLAALAMGAADTLAKPSSGTFGDAYRQELLGKIVALARRGPASAIPAVTPAEPCGAGRAWPARARPAVIAIGASTGGIHALGRFFGALPRTVALPILITQHLPQAFMPVFARQISTMAGRPAMVAEEGMPLSGAQVLIAPGDGHLMLQESKGDIVVKIASFPAPSGCCPSVDPMLEAVARHYGPAGLGVVLSGMGRDGTLGARTLCDAGGTLLAQDEESCAVFGMPRGIVEAGLSSATRAPEELAAMIGQRAGAA